jgi:hypothetical protein
MLGREYDCAVERVPVGAAVACNAMTLSPFSENFRSNRFVAS